MSFLIRGSLFLFCLIAALSPGAQTIPATAPLPAVSTPAQDTELWLLRTEERDRMKVRVRLAGEASHPGEGLLALQCSIESDQSFQRTIIDATVTNEAGTVVYAGQMTLDLQQGINNTRFNWDTTGVPLGLYTVTVSADYTNAEDPAVFRQIYKKVGRGQLGANLEQAAASVAALNARLQQLAPGTMPYAVLRANIASDFVEVARSEQSLGNWENLDTAVAYIERTVAEVEAFLAFSSQAPELVQPIPQPRLENLQVRDSLLMAEERPVYLFGRGGMGLPLEQLDRLRRYGLNFAAPVIPTGTASAAFFEEALRQNISLTPQLQIAGASQATGASVVLADGNLANVQVSLDPLMAQQLTGEILALTAQRMVNSISIAELPRFKFDGEAVRQAFKTYISARYPDRHELNRIWRSHLADVDEIQLWRTDPEQDFQLAATRPYDTEFGYQTRTFYQFDWQQFHRTLGSAYMRTLQAVAKQQQLGREAPLQVKFSEHAFQPGETRRGVDREAMAQAFGIIGVTATATPSDKFYATAYPGQSALYALMHSLAPGRPLFNLEDHILLEAGLDPLSTYAYVHTTVWEGAMAGRNASALDENTTLFAHPNALEGYATAALDINRLSPIVAAMQEAPVDVAIVYSESSRILDDGIPHLESARFAYEGCSFAGYKVGFVTERQIEAGILDSVKVLVIPETPAISDKAFDAIEAYATRGGTVARVGTPIPYNEFGQSRRGGMQSTPRTVLIRGMNLPTEYLHGMDAAMVQGTLPPVPRTTNSSGYPLEGVKTRFVEVNGDGYLYLVNLRKEPIECHLTGIAQHGRDLIRARDVQFPRVVPPMEPMLIRLDREGFELTLEPVVAAKK